MLMVRRLVRRTHDGDGLRKTQDSERTQDNERTQDMDGWRATDDAHALKGGRLMMLMPSRLMMLMPHALKLSSSQLSKARQA